MAGYWPSSFFFCVFVGDGNPYQTEAKSAEFFSCGFLQNTYIFVAESLVDEVMEQWQLFNPIQFYFSKQG